MKKIPPRSPLSQRGEEENPPSVPPFSKGGRNPPQPKERTRQKILDAAARLFRERGVESASLPEIMQAAGLTVGGFYRHFESKEDLFRAAVEEAMDETLERMRAGRGRYRSELSGSRQTGASWLEAAARIYLDPAHRDNVAGGCPLPVLTPDVARREGPARRSFERALAAIVDELEAKMPAGDCAGAARERAWGFLATLVGGLLLARGVEDDGLAAEILAACRSAAASSAGSWRRFGSAVPAADSRPEKV